MMAKRNSIETTGNLDAIREFFPEAKTVAHGLRHLLNNEGRESITVYRLIKSHGAKLEEKQVAKFKKRVPKRTEDKGRRTFYSDVSEEYLNRSHGPLLYNAYLR